MPQCRHCKRDLASCEVRKTSLGYVCKERSPSELGKFSRCYKLTRERLQAARAAARKATAA